MKIFYPNKSKSFFSFTSSITSANTAQFIHGRLKFLYLKSIHIQEHRKTGYGAAKALFITPFFHAHTHGIWTPRGHNTFPLEKVCMQPRRAKKPSPAVIIHTNAMMKRFSSEINADVFYSISNLNMVT